MGILRQEKVPRKGKNGMNIFMRIKHTFLFTITLFFQCKQRPCLCYVHHNAIMDFIKEEFDSSSDYRKNIIIYSGLEIRISRVLNSLHIPSIKIFNII